MMMMAANLVGFVVGVEGVSFFASQLFGTFEGRFLSVRFIVSCLISDPAPDPLPGVRFLVGVVFCLFIGAQLMFEYR